MKDLITLTSPHPVHVTVDALLTELQNRSITLFARIDHAQAAHSVGLELAEETVLIFGNPQAGTPLMQEDARVGLDLPLRILIWDDSGTTRIAYHDPVLLTDNYSLKTADQTLTQMRNLLDNLAAQATR